VELSGYSVGLDLPGTPMDKKVVRGLNLLRRRVRMGPPYASAHATAREDRHDHHGRESGVVPFAMMSVVAPILNLLVILRPGASLKSAM